MSADVILLAYTAICQCGSCMKSVYEFQSLQVLVLWCALSTLYIYKVSFQRLILIVFIEEMQLLP